jgi:Zn-dependent protease/predicted transcriptional regulator
MAEPKLSPHPAQARSAHRAWSLYIARIAGIPVYLHFTFILLLVFVGFMDVQREVKVFGGIFFVLAIFASVALHELGHALMARRFGIKTDDIVLYPIGGVARLRSLGEGFQEFWIAIAGPSVNVVIAAILLVILTATGHWIPFATLMRELDKGNEAALMSVGFWQHVALINLMLVVFNLIPAFPMDGGRVLRAVLTRILPKPRATAIAAKVGQGVAIVFMMLGGLYNPFLLFIGLFVFLAAGQELAMTRSSALMAGRKIHDAMIRHFETLSHGDSLGRAADLLLSTTQQDFPVMGGQQLLGVLGRRALVHGLATLGRDHYVAEVMAREFPRVRPDDDLQLAMALLREGQGTPVMVMDGDRFVGYINNENLMEYFLVAQSGHA